MLAQKNSDKGDKLFDKNLFAEAIPFYEQEIEDKNKKTFDHATLRLADCYRITGEFEKAEITYKIYLKKNKKEPAAVLNYALSLKSSAKYAEAAIQFAAYIKLNPSDPLGKIFLKSCDLAQVWLDETIGKEVRNVEKINSPESDFAPVFLSPTELVFTSSRTGGTEALISFNGGMEMRRLDLYDVNVNSIEESKKAGIENFKAINTSLHEGPATFSKDGKEIYFTRTIAGERDTKTNNVLNTLQVFYCIKDSTGKWSKPVSAFSFNSTKYSVGQPSISKDGKTIFFMSDMPGGQGTTDIYYCTKQKDGTWSKPINAGDEVNTFGHELFPYISDNGVLYFSSDTHPGMGQLDIFSAEFDGFEWADVFNLKPPINSIANDFGIALDGKYMRGFFSSDRFNGKGAEDIYSFSETTALKLTINGGNLQFPDKSIFDGIKYKLIDEKNATETALEPKEGIYSMALKKDQNYTLVAKKNGFSYNKILINIRRDTLGNYLEATLKPSLRTILVDGYLLTNVKIDSLKTEEIPLGNISVSLLDSTTTVEKSKTIKNGFFEFRQLLIANGAYTIRAKTTTKKGGTDLTIKCKGTVKHKGNPLLDASVQLLENGKLAENIKTNKKGEFIFEILPDKKYTLKASKNGYDPNSTSFTTSKSDAKDGIYKTLSLEPLKEIEKITLKGIVKDSTGVLKNALVVIRNGSQIVGETRSGDDGVFSFKLLPNNEYIISANSKGYMQKDKIVSATDQRTSKESIVIVLEPIQVNSTMIWDNIFFVYGKSEVEAASLPTLDKLVKFMLTNPAIKIELSAHTDTRGDAESNLTLSQERAQYAKNYLTMEDIDAERVVATGYGESRPLIPNEKTEKDYQTNRRIEVRIIKQ